MVVPTLDYQNFDISAYISKPWLRSRDSQEGKGGVGMGGLGLLPLGHFQHFETISNVEKTRGKWSFNTKH